MGEEGEGEGGGADMIYGKLLSTCAEAYCRGWPNLLGAVSLAPPPPHPHPPVKPPPPWVEVICTCVYACIFTAGDHSECV